MSDLNSGSSALARRSLRALAALLALLLASMPAHADAILDLGKIGYTARVPDSWRAEPPSSSFRLAQFALPGSTGDADCIFFYFGPGQGGSVDANIERWQSQFRSADGGPVQPTLERITVSKLPVTLVELAGNYSRGIGMGPAGEASPDQIMRVAIIETPQGNLIIQLYGPRDAVGAQRAAFDAMVRSFGRRN
jgi:hypothetical protein